MDYNIRLMKVDDWHSVSDIYMQGIQTNIATFQTEVPSYEEWDKNHLDIGRFVAVDSEGIILGWIALSPTSSRCVYRGVVEVSIYVHEAYRKNNIGYELIQKEIEETEKNGIWTLQSGILSINDASIALHKKCGFRIVGIREKIAMNCNGVWQNTVLMERRSSKVGV